MLEMGLSRSEVIDLLKESLSMSITKKWDTKTADFDIVIEVKIKDEVILTASSRENSGEGK